MLGSINLAMGLGLPNGSLAVSGGLQNIAARGQIHNGTTVATAAKTRFKGIYRFTIGDGGALSIAPVFANVWINNATQREVNGAASYTIRKAAIAYEGVCVPLLFGGQRSTAVAPGALLQSDSLLPSQFGISRFQPGFVAFVRMSIDVATGQTVAGHPSPLFLAGESALQFDPVNDVDDIDATTWVEPVGADKWIAFPGPVMLVGQPYVPVTSLVGIGDSIVDGSVDNAGDGATGGGWLRRAAYAQNLPYLSISRTGDKAQYVAQSNAKTRELIKLAGAHAAIIALGNNDIRDGRTYAQFTTDLQMVLAILRDCGVAHIGQAQILAESSSTDQTSSTAGQTTGANFGTASVREQANAYLSGLAGGLINDVLDIVSPVQTANKWNVPAYDAVLAAAVVVSSGSVSLNRAPLVGDLLVFEPGAPANQDVSWIHVTGVTGTGPYAATLVGGPTKAHASGVAVRATLSADGIHPQQQAHKAIAIKTAPAIRRLAAVRSPWINPAKSFEIDFVNRRAQAGGVALPIAALLNCSRTSGGRASDGQSWFDFGNDSLRYADGGGLFVEPARTNFGRNNTMQAGSAPATKPNNWNLNIGNGLTTSTYAYGMENGIAFVDVRLAGTTTNNSGVSVDFEQGIATLSGDVWDYSMFIALAGGSLANVPSIKLGGRTGNAGGSGVEFPAGPDIKDGLTRIMSRKDFSFAIANATSVNINPRLSVAMSTAAVVDITLRVGLPQMEKGPTPTSPILTSNAIATRAADIITIALPAGNHDLTFIFDDGSTQAIGNVTGSYVVPINLNRGVINAVAGVLRAS